MKHSLVLIVVLAACGGDDGSSSDANTGGDAAHSACVDTTNMYRTMNGKPAVAHSAALESYADTGAMVDFSSSPHNHFSSTSGGGIAFAENECPQQGNWTVGADVVATVKACVKAFYDEGPGGGHYDNMMGAYAKLGCGIYQSGGKITIVQDYGN